MAGRTEWEDAQIRLGNMKAPEPTFTEEDLVSMVEAAAQAYTREPTISDKLEKASLDELDEFEDDAEDQIIAQYRDKRLAEMKAAAAAAKYGSLREISGSEWSDEVTKASANVHVIAFLYKPSNPHCQIFSTRLAELARKHPATKFIKVVSDEAIRNYPDKYIPTILIYFKGDVLKQTIGLEPYGGESLTCDDIEWVLSRCGAVKTSLEENPRKGEHQQHNRKAKGFVTGFSWGDKTDEDD